MAALSEQVFQTLREQILNGEYTNGEELTESAVAKKEGVSRTPVREALHQLELEGLVKLIPNKGAVVTGITAKDVRDIYVMRSYLEGLSALWAARYATPEEIDRLEETVFLSEFHAGKEHFEQVYELDSRFHHLLYEASHSRILANSLEEYHQYVKMVRRKTVMERIRANRCNDEHHQIVDALRERDGERAKELANKHIINSIENMSQYDLEALLEYKKE